VKLLPIVIFAGGMLFHGHVAQPLFVIPLGCLALSSVVRRGEYKNAHMAISALILAVFVLPIMVDALRGSGSNIATIFHHIKTHAGDHHTVSQGIGYFLSFFLYENKQNIVQESATFSRASYLWAHPTLWLVIFVLFAAASLGYPSHSGYNTAAINRSQAWDALHFSDPRRQSTRYIVQGPSLNASAITRSSFSPI
jgi:hypothetical protein